jgi:hypothetical protein
VTDPLKFVQVVTAYSRVIAVGGDAGGGYTKIGITYMGHRQRQMFAPLLVYNGKESWEELNYFNRPGVTPYIGDTAQLGKENIFQVLQHLIDSPTLCVLNGDWNFMSAILGHQGASSTFPCPICTVGKQIF